MKIGKAELNASHVRGPCIAGFKLIPNRLISSVNRLLEWRVLIDFSYPAMEQKIECEYHQLIRLSEPSR